MFSSRMRTLRFEPAKTLVTEAEGEKKEGHILVEMDSYHYRKFLTT